MQEVDVHAFAIAHAEGAYVIDVREPFEYRSGHVPGARLVPMGRLTGEAGTLPTGEPLYVICASGNRSGSAAAWLAGRGLDARSVAGGIRAWAEAGLPVVRGRQRRHR